MCGGNVFYKGLIHRNEESKRSNINANAEHFLPTFATFWELVRPWLEEIPNGCFPTQLRFVFQVLARYRALLHWLSHLSSQKVIIKLRICPRSGHLILAVNPWNGLQFELFGIIQLPCILFAVPDDRQPIMLFSISPALSPIQISVSLSETENMHNMEEAFLNRRLFAVTIANVRGHARK